MKIFHFVLFTILLLFTSIVISTALFYSFNTNIINPSLHQSIWIYCAGIFLSVIVMAFILFIGIKRLIVNPLQMLTHQAKKGEECPERFFIREIETLNRTLGHAFRTVQLQNEILEAALEESRHLDQILRTVAEITQHLIASKSVSEMAQKACYRLSGYQGYGMCWIGVVSDDELEVVGCTSDPMQLIHEGMKINLSSEDALSFAPSIKAYRENKTVLLDHLEDEKSLVSWNDIAKEGEYGSLIALPLCSSSHEPPLGVLTLYAYTQEGIGDKEQGMLQELAGDIGFAIHAYRSRELLKHHLTIDPVSGLANRLSMIDYLAEQPISGLAILNIDRFSDINAVYGVSIGDGIIFGYGHWLAQKVEKASGVTLFKLGSDEYALLFKEGDELDDNIAFLEYLVDMTAQESFMIEGIDIVISITVGYSPSSDKMLEQATQALKQAKLEHKPLRVYVPSAETKKEQENNIAWYKEIKEALEESRIVPYFQPIVDNASQRIIKYEALIRLIREDGSVVSPFHFLDIAKKIRLYPSLTRVMIDRVLEQFKGLDIPVSINLSTEDIIEPELGNYLEEMIIEYQIGKWIIFEILESEGIGNYAEVSAFIERFKAIGCSFAIDDFGAGYSNFEHLLKLNIDTLKIDGSLIKNLPHDYNAQIIVRHISSFAKEMGIKTVAEFVANQAIYDKVIELGIDASQGYFFYEPSPLLPQ